MPTGPRKPVKRYNGRFYWLTRDAALGLALLCPPGRILGTQRFPRGRGRILSTQRIPRGRDPDGGDVDENGFFLYVKRVFRWTKNQDGGEDILNEISGAILMK